MERAHAVIQVTRVTQAAETGSGETTTVNLLLPLDEMANYGAPGYLETALSKAIDNMGEAIRNRLGTNNAMIRAKAAERHAEKLAAKGQKPGSSSIAPTVTHDT